MKTLFVSDLDGTLLTPESRLSQKTLDILNPLIARGLPFTYATARSFNSARIVTRGLELCLPAIIFNGTMRVDTATGTLENIQLLPQSVLDAVSAQICPPGAPSPFAYAFIDGRERVSYLADRLTDGMRAYIASRPGDQRFRALDDAARLFDGDVFYVTFVDTQARLCGMARLAQALDCIAVFQNYAHSTDPSWWLEMMPSGATKAAAIRALKAELGCERIVCFGDSINDRSMFQIADEAYAVEGSHPDLLPYATAVIPDNAHDGVAEFLQKRFENVGF